MIPQIQNISTSNKDIRTIVNELVEAVNTLSQQLQIALQNIDGENVTLDTGASLSELLASGELKGEQGNQGLPGRVYRPAVTAEGVISWVLTDEGGITPPPQNIKGPVGSKGDTGPRGEAGAPGIGVPAGGIAGQVLMKKSDIDYETEWVSL